MAVKKFAKNVFVVLKNFPSWYSPHIWTVERGPLAIAFLQKFLSSDHFSRCFGRRTLDQKVVSVSVFFGSIYYKRGVQKTALKKMTQIVTSSKDSISVLRPFQKKNPREKTKISPRCARRQGDRRRKKQEEKFFVFRIVGPKAAEGCFSLNLLQNKARGARGKFLGCF